MADTTCAVETFILFYFILPFCSLDRPFPRLLWLVHSVNSFSFKSTGYLRLETKDTSVEKIKNDWEEELGRVIDDDDDYKCPLTGVNDTTSCCGLGLIQFKVVHRICFINSRRDMTHMFWNRSCLRGYRLLDSFFSNTFRQHFLLN